MTRKGIFLVVLVMTALLGGAGIVLLNSEGEKAALQSTEAAEKPHQSRTYFENILSGGVPMDGIPPIENPLYMTMEDADLWLEDSDRIFALETPEGVFLYPQRILVWHEIVNEEIEGQSLSVTYCPLTGSCVGYYGVDGTTFGTSGRLLNSNLVMYDRQTEQYWSQILGRIVSKKGVGRTLEVEPIHWTTWALAKSAYVNDDVHVLSDETGFFRDYGKDPYGSYAHEDSYYYNSRIMFPVMSEDTRLPAKKVVVGVKGPDGVLAIDPEYVKTEKIVYSVAGGQPIVAVYDFSIEAVRVYMRAEGEMPEDVYDLERADHFDVMWFAWAAFYPDTRILE